MKTVLTTMTLAAFLATNAAAGGRVTVVNRGNHNIELTSYDWDDGFRAAPADYTGSIRPGSSGTVTCKKSWTDSNAPGCYVQIENFGGVMSDLSGKKKNGTWELKGAWEGKIYQDGVHYSERASITQVLGSEVAIQKGRLPNPSGGTTDCLYKGTEEVLADNGLATLKWRLDGNLVLYDARGDQWTTGTNPDATGVCFQGDGNLVVYRDGEAYWSTHTDGGGQVLKLQPDCNIVIQDANGTTLWQAGTRCRN